MTVVIANRVKPIIYAALTAKGYQVRADDLEILAARQNSVPDIINNLGPRIVLIISGRYYNLQALETASN